MTVHTVIHDCRTALANAITAAGITCYTYSTFDLPQNPPLATLTLDGISLARFDQGIGIGVVRLLMETYQLAEGAADIAQQNADADIGIVMSALGSDVTLGGKVVSTEIVDDPEHHFQTRPGGMYSVMTWHVELEPFPNVA